MNKSTQWNILAAGIIAWAASAPGLAADKMGTVTVKFPGETAQLKPGPGIETARKYCLECHSADYIYMQPPLTKDQWHGEVAKMKKAYGAAIEEGDIDAIARYLESQNGKP